MGRYCGPTWLIVTAQGAEKCDITRRLEQLYCQPLDRGRAMRYIREVSGFRPLGALPSDLVGHELDANKQSLQINYVGFISVYADGKSSQRPISVSEELPASRAVAKWAGAEYARLDRAMARLDHDSEAFKIWEANVSRLQQQMK